jgi:hypothetical protein
VRKYTTFYLAGLLILIQVAHAQVDTGAISGIVKDSSGAVVVAATVKITQPETSITSTFVTNGDGFYSAPSLRIGKYDIEVSAVGFASQAQKDIELRVQDRLNFDFTLSLGQTSTTLTVEAIAPILQTEDS